MKSIFAFIFFIKFPINSLKTKVEPSNTGAENQVLTKTSDGQSWQDKDGGLVVSTTQPAGKDNAIWINPSTGVIKYWNGTSWANTYGVFLCDRFVREPSAVCYWKHWQRCSEV